MGGGVNRSKGQQANSSTGQQVNKSIKDQTNLWQCSCMPGQISTKKQNEPASIFFQALQAQEAEIPKSIMDFLLELLGGPCWFYLFYWGLWMPCWCKQTLLSAEGTSHAPQNVGMEPLVSAKWSWQQQVRTVQKGTTCKGRPPWR